MMADFKARETQNEAAHVDAHEGHRAVPLRAVRSQYAYRRSNEPRSIRGLAFVAGVPARTFCDESLQAMPRSMPVRHPPPKRLQRDALLVEAEGPVPSRHRD